MKTTSSVNADGLQCRNDKDTLVMEDTITEILLGADVQDAHDAAAGLPARTAVKAGNPGANLNHNETMGNGLLVRTALKAGGLQLKNHNETLAIDDTVTEIFLGVDVQERRATAAGLPARTAVKAGNPGTSFNHNETMAGGLLIRTALKAGGLKLDNHNETMASGLLIRTALKAGGLKLDNHNETLAGPRVQTAVKAGLKIKRSD